MQMISKHWHHLPGEEVVELLETDPIKGLDSSEAEAHQQRFGPNRLTQRKGQGPLLRFLLQFHQPLIYILLVATAVTAFLQEWVDAGVIFGVVLVNAVIGFLQESKAIKAIEALSRSLSSEATVMRGGEKKKIAAVDLVPGDIVLLQSGDKVPADMRLLRVRELQIDESSLTGESVPVAKSAERLMPDTVLADRRNMAYSSTLVSYGTGAGVVVGIGDATEIGRISKLIATAEVLATPLTRKIAHFSHILLYVILALAGLTFLLGILQGEPWEAMFMAAVALAVGAIPEGLPAAVTIALAIGVGRMAKQNAIIRKLPAVETLGSTTVICSDKTGTLTQNQMTVQEIFAGSWHVSLSGSGYAPTGEFVQAGEVVGPVENPALLECLKAGLLCNDSLLRQTEEGWRVEGDPTEAALIVSALKAGLSRESIEQELPRLDAIPFESQHQYMATLHASGFDRPRVAYLKGSVESILARCDDALDATGRRAPLDKPALYERAEHMAAQGLRVLALARIELPANTRAIDHPEVASGLTFLGLQGMLDPPRPEAIKAVAACQEAGIRVKMITGDHAKTAAAIAAQIGLKSNPAIDKVNAVTGRGLAELPDQALIEIAERSPVFARVAPEQKLRLVEALQAKGNVVAMTGDGVNDAPALRRADIGVAMGITGTEVAKEAADMILTDDNFSSIEAAVEEGRGVYDNLIKFITWTLPTNLGEGLVIMAAVFLGSTLPILPVQVLWINMTTAVCLGLMLAFEAKEPGIMQRPPRDPRSPILSRALVFRIFLVGFLLLIGAFGLFRWALTQGASDAEARTIAANMFVMGELFYLFNCRSLTHSFLSMGLFSNRWFYAGITTMVLLQWLFTYAPAMNELFYTAPIGLFEWSLILAAGLALSMIVGLEKWTVASLKRIRLRKPVERRIPIEAEARAMVERAPIPEPLKTESMAGIALIAAAALALGLANSPLAEFYRAFWHLPLEVRVGPLYLQNSLLLWLNQGLMALLFLLFGLMLKREVLEGRFFSPSQRVLPIMGALGGLLVPPLICYGFNPKGPAWLETCLLTAATDMALVLGLLLVLGRRIPLALKLFLMAVALLDNVAASFIVLFTEFMKQPIAHFQIAGAALLALIFMNRLRIARPAAYLLVGVLLWAESFRHGLPAAPLGFLVALAIPRSVQAQHAAYPSLERALHPWIAFAILPLFVLANAGLSVEGLAWEDLLAPESVGIVMGLFLGAPLGIFTLTWLGSRLAKTKLPAGMTWRGLFGIAVLAGAGFSMSLLIDSLPLETAEEILESANKFPIFVSALLSTVLGLLLLRFSRIVPS